MITLAQLFKNMAYGELANVALGNALTGEIQPENHERLVSHVQLGLTALHQRFLIRQGQVVIRNNVNIGRYYLDPAFALSNLESTAPIKYIIDSPHKPFTGNVLKIEQIFDELGREHELNKAGIPDPIFTPEMNCITMTPVVGDAMWTVVYRADHDPLVYTPTDFDPTKVILQIPPQYIEPLQCYVAHRLLGGMSHVINEATTEGDKYLLKYEMLCAKLEQKNLDLDDNQQHTRLEDNGWP